MGLEILENKSIIFLDIETTGLNFDLDRIIELGVVEYYGMNKILEYSRLFSGGKCPIHLVNNCHGIKDSDRDKEPSFEQQADKIAKYLSNHILAGHNILKFDIPMIENKLAIANQKLENVEFIDTYVLAKRFKVATVDLKLGTLCKNFNLAYGNHRGLGDAKSVYELLMVFIKNFDIKDIKEIQTKR